MFLFGLRFRLIFHPRRMMNPAVIFIIRGLFFFFFSFSACLLYGDFYSQDRAGQHTATVQPRLNTLYLPDPVITRDWSKLGSVFCLSSPAVRSMVRGRGSWEGKTRCPNFAVPWFEIFEKGRRNRISTDSLYILQSITLCSVWECIHLQLDCSMIK